MVQPDVLELDDDGHNAVGITAFRLGVTNLLDQRGLLGRTGGDTATDVGGLSSFYNRPRALSLRLTAEF